MKKVYRKCTNCNGTGTVRIFTHPEKTTTAGNGSYTIQCTKCLGTSKVETEYFFED